MIYCQGSPRCLSTSSKGKYLETCDACILRLSCRRQKKGNLSGRRKFTPKMGSILYRVFRQVERVRTQKWHWKTYYSKRWRRRKSPQTWIVMKIPFIFIKMCFLFLYTIFGLNILALSSTQAKSSLQSWTTGRIWTYHVICILQGVYCTCPWQAWCISLQHIKEHEMSCLNFLWVIDQTEDDWIQQQSHILDSSCVGL